MKFPRLFLFAICAAAFAGPALVGPALAGPREDTLAGISRCAGIADDRSFLDCIYGAAQPLRAELGLPAALPSQTRLVPPPPVVASRPLPSRAAPPPVASAAPQRQSPGFFGRLFGGGQADATLHMASYSFDNRGMFTVTLSDGEVWRQMGYDTNYAHWKGPASRYAVSVAEGAFGGGSLQVSGDTASYSVERLH